jgi:hypothetical protein
MIYDYHKCFDCVLLSYPGRPGNLLLTTAKTCLVWLEWKREGSRLLIMDELGKKHCIFGTICMEQFQSSWLIARLSSHVNFYKFIY